MSEPSNTKAGKGCATLFFGVFAVMGLIFFGFICNLTWSTVSEYSWTETDCTIVTSRLGTGDKKSTLEISYSYQFGGRDFTGTRFRSSGNQFDNVRDAQRAMLRFGEDTQAKCFVNESAPEESVLQRGSLAIAFVALFPLIFVAIGVGGIVLAWRSSSPRAKPVSERAVKVSTQGRLVVRVLGAVFTVAGGVALYFITIRTLAQVRASAGWTETPCVVTSSSVKYHSGDNGTTYSIDINYRYEFGGREYVGDSYNFINSSSSNREWRDEVVRKHPAGTRTVCYVDPADPISSVLVRESGGAEWFGLIPGVFILAGVGMLYGAGRMGPAKRPSSMAGAGLHANSPEKLKAASSPYLGCIVVGIIAAIWNGVIWGILLNAKLSTAPKIILGFFALVGLGIVAGAVHQFLAIFNPKPELSARASEVPLGGAIEVEFKLTGNVKRIAHLTVTLEGREAATYRRGTTTTTDKSVFARVSLLDTRSHSEMSTALLRAVVPVNSMHSFDAPNNKIRWALRVHGDIPRWPDIDTEYPITVLPAERAV